MSTLEEYFASVAAALPAPVATAPTPYDAVLLLGFGGPEGQDDVLPYLRNVTGGRGIPDERLEEVAVHYRAYGGVSPINDQNRQLRAALEAELAARGWNLPVVWGNRNWAPYLADTLREAHAAGHRRILTLVTSAYSSYSGCRQYREDLARALEETGLAGELQIDKIRQYFDHPGFVGPFVDGVQGAAARLRSQLTDAAGEPAAGAVRVLCSTHSIPTAASRATGPQDGVPWRDGGAYEAQHLAVAALVMDAAGLAGTPWELVYQSRSGAPTTPWLEPDINDRITELAGEGVRGVVIVPLGFVSDHMEVLWDLDNEAITTATSLGVLAERVPTPGVDPQFVTGLADLVGERLEGATRRSDTRLGPWFDVCPSGCCLNPAGAPKPAVAGGNP